MKRFLWRHFLGIFSSVCLLHCGTETPQPALNQTELSGDFGEILINYLVEPTADPSQPSQGSLSVTGRFFRVRDVGSADARSLLGRQLPPLDVPVGDCQTVEAFHPRQENVLVGSLELLDAGDMTLSVGDEQARIPNWNFPSVFGVVAGVVYGGDVPLSLSYRPTRQYRVETSGTNDIGPIEVRLPAPDELGPLVVAGTEVGLEGVTLETNVPLEIRWEPGRNPSAVIIELSYSHFGSEQRVVCRTEDEGLFEMPANLVSDLWEAGVSDIRLVIHQRMRRSFRVAGLDEGEVLFLASTVVPLSVR